MIRHHFTVDVEEYFQVTALEPHVRRDAWSGFESRVAESMSRLLELLARHDAHGTFFVLGWLAQRIPELVRAIVEGGHEVASHGWDHERVTRQSPENFRLSIRRSRETLEDLAGQPVVGFRAPSFSIVPGREWALDLLLEEGYRYDSSLFPIWRRGYGYPGTIRDTHLLARSAGCIAVVPPMTLRRCGVNLPAAGGAYFRLLPYGVVRSAFLDAQHRGAPGTFYIHPWEIDPDQPRLPVGWLTRIRHYRGLDRTFDRLERLLGEFRFCSIAQTLASS